MHLRAALPTCLLLALAVSGCAPRDTAGNQVTGGTRVESETATAALPSTPARRVYVQDFALDVGGDRAEDRARSAGRASSSNSPARIRRRTRGGSSTRWRPRS